MTLNHKSFFANRANVLHFQSFIYDFLDGKDKSSNRVKKRVYL
jgi:hypothetical protein